ncbi:MAG: hypothetical protein ACLFSQ_10575 [Candidatus Zixiibacteriota bacterium]
MNDLVNQLKQKYDDLSKLIKIIGSVGTSLTQKKIANEYCNLFNEIRNILELPIFDEKFGCIDKNKYKSNGFLSEDGQTEIVKNGLKLISFLEDVIDDPDIIFKARNQELSKKSSNSQKLEGKPAQKEKSITKETAKKNIDKKLKDAIDKTLMKTQKKEVQSGEVDDEDILLDFEKSQEIFDDDNLDFNQLIMQADKPELILEKQKDFSLEPETPKSEDEKAENLKITKPKKNKLAQKAESILISSQIAENGNQRNRYEKPKKNGGQKRIEKPIESVFAEKNVQKPKIEPASVFVSYSRQSHALFLLNNYLYALGVIPIMVMHKPNASREVSELATSQMKSCECAIILATGDLKTNSGVFKYPSNIVIKEIMEARKIFDDKIIYLLEENAKFPENIKPDSYDSFTDDNLSEAFIRIVHRFRKYGIIQ